MVKKTFNDVATPMIHEPEGEIRSVYYRQTVGYDKDGRILFDVMSRPKWQNGGGFVISYTEKVCDFLAKYSTGSVVRLFLYIAHRQSYGQGGCFGFRCSHKYLQQVLKLDRSTVWEGLKLLKEKGLVNESRVDGHTEFMVNPDYVTIGADKKTRVRVWASRTGQGTYTDSDVRSTKANLDGLVSPLVRPRSSVSLDDDICEMN